MSTSVFRGDYHSISSEVASGQLFGAIPEEVEWLTDNGSCYIADETRQFAKSLGFKVCTTPVRSPQSNGMAEAFVKTFKRDYVYMNDRPDAETVMAQLADWFGDYNNYRKRPAKAVLTGETGYSAGRATRQGSSSLTRFTGQSAITFSTCRR